MKLSARTDIDAPIAGVWAVLTDYEAFERAAMRRGAEVLRGGSDANPYWHVGFVWRGKPRRLHVRLDAQDPGSLLRFSGTGATVEGGMVVEAVELGRQRTRLTVTTEVRPRTLAARLFLQSLRLARGRVMRRYRQRIEQLGTIVAQRSRERAV